MQQRSQHQQQRRRAVHPTCRTVADQRIRVYFRSRTDTSTSTNPVEWAPFPVDWALFFVEWVRAGELASRRWSLTSELASDTKGAPSTGRWFPSAGSSRDAFCFRPAPLAIVLGSHADSHGRVAEWQTRWLQVPVSFGTWGFKSPFAHHEQFSSMQRQWSGPEIRA